MPVGAAGKVKTVLLEIYESPLHPDSRQIAPQHPHATDPIRYLRVPQTDVDLIYALKVSPGVAGTVDIQVRFIDYGPNLNVPDE